MNDTETLEESMNQKLRDIRIEYIFKYEQTLDRYAKLIDNSASWMELIEVEMQLNDLETLINGIDVILHLRAIGG